MTAALLAAFTATVLAGVPEVPPSVVNLVFECETVPTSCLRAADWLRASPHRAHRKKGVEVLGKACLGGVGIACEKAAADSAKLEMPKQDRLSWIKQGCFTVRHAPTCILAADIIKKNARSTADIARALRLFTFACLNDAELGCRGALEILETSKEARPLEYGYWLRQTCVRNLANSCDRYATWRAAHLPAIDSARVEPTGSMRCASLYPGEPYALDRCVAEHHLQFLSFEEAALIASGVSSLDEMRTRLAQLETAVAHIAAAAKARAPSGDANLLAATTNWAMHGLYLRAYDEEATTLLDILDTANFNCLSSTILYVLAVERAGAIASAYLMNGHILPIVFAKPKPLFVEATGPHGLPSDVWNPVLPEGYESAAARARTAASAGPIEMLGALYWNRTFRLVAKGEAAAAGRTLRLALQLSSEKNQRAMWNTRAMEVRNFALAIGHRDGWEAADQLIRYFVEAIPAIRETAAFRDAQALVFVSWLKQMPTGDPKACAVLTRFRRLDPDHPASALVPAALMRRCRVQP